jgi:leucyl aminopeptidase
VSTAGFFATDKDIVERVKQAAEDAHENFWHMPLNDEHRGNNKSKWGADICNLPSSRFGGASSAAAFLEAFIEDERPWFHMDIAGPGIFNEKETGGFGAKTLLYLVHNL